MKFCVSALGPSLLQTNIYNNILKMAAHVMVSFSASVGHHPRIRQIPLSEQLPVVTPDSCYSN